MNPKIFGKELSNYLIDRQITIPSILVEKYRNFPVQKLPVKKEKIRQAT